MRCICKCCLRKFQCIGSKIVYWSKVFLSKGMVLYFFQKGCYIRTGILVILRCNVISIVIVLTKNRAQEIWTNEKNFLKTFPKESYLMLFFDKLDRKYLLLNMQIFYTTVWNIFSLGENYHQELFFTLIKKKVKKHNMPQNYMVVCH